MNIHDALSAEAKIKKFLKTHCRVTFDSHGEAGEIRIFFENKKELNRVLSKLGG